MGSKGIVKLDNNRTDVPRPCRRTSARAHLPYSSTRQRFEGKVKGDKQLRIPAMS